MGRPLIAVFRLTDVIQGKHRPPFAYSHALQDPRLIGSDLQFFQESVRDDIFRMEMADAVKVEH
jgi:hypothetical protein